MPEESRGLWQEACRGKLRAAPWHDPCNARARSFFCWLFAVGRKAARCGRVATACGPVTTRPWLANHADPGTRVAYVVGSRGRDLARGLQDESWAAPGVAVVAAGRAGRGRWVWRLGGRVGRVLGGAVRSAGGRPGVAARADPRALLRAWRGRRRSWPPGAGSRRGSAPSRPGSPRSGGPRCGPGARSGWSGPGSRRGSGTRGAGASSASRGGGSGPPPPGPAPLAERRTHAHNRDRDGGPGRS